jgi:nitrogenase subunit NifH
MQPETLYRKQYLISGANLAKLEEITRKKNISAAEAVRSAIEAFDPDAPKDDAFSAEAMQLLANQLAIAIQDTRQNNEKIEALLADLGEDA